MLYNLNVENVALIKKAEITFSQGFNIITGETGAGKSILIHSVNMLLGERVNRDMIRSGETYAYVEGLFYVDQKTQDYCNSLEIPVDDEEVLVSRRLTADGKNLCKIGGKTVTVSQLRQVGKHLVNIHGQHDNQALLDDTTHIDFVDAYIKEKIESPLTQYRILYSKLTKLKKEQSMLNTDESERLRRLDMLQYEIDEIRQAEIRVGEEEELEKTARLLKNKEHFLESCTKTLLLLYEEDTCAYQLLSEAQNTLAHIQDQSNVLEQAYEKISDAVYSIEDAASIIRNELDNASYENISLEEVGARLDVIYRLKRKYGSSEEEILEYLKKAEAEAAQLENADARKEEIMHEIEVTEKKAVQQANLIHEMRLAAAKDIEKSIEREFQDLCMENAHFTVQITEIPMGENGTDRVIFLFSANQGMEKKSLSKIISGGELSRVMLALKNVLVAGDDTQTFIFDEIDTGISGRVADKVGKKLLEIANCKQVLCITHLPQIASYAQQHYKIKKSSENETTETDIKNLSKTERVREIAFMIGGDQITDTTLKQAEDMITARSKGVL